MESANRGRITRNSMTEHSTRTLLKSILGAINEATLPSDGSPPINDINLYALYYTLGLYCETNLELRWPDKEERIT